MTNTAMAKVKGRPVALAVHLAKRVNQDFECVGRMTRYSNLDA